MQQNAVDVKPLLNTTKTLSGKGQTPLFLAMNHQLAGVLGISDPIKQDSKQAIHLLQQLGLEVIMLTGDNHITAQAVAHLVGIPRVLAEVLPQAKAHEVQKLQAQHKLVGMVGDGVNDAPALAQSTVGFAIGSGTDVAIESASIALMRDSLMGVVAAIKVSKATLRNIKQNLWGAFLYNTLGIPVAAGILYPWLHTLLNPMIAGLAMVISSLTVVINANRLKRMKSLTNLHS